LPRPQVRGLCFFELRKRIKIFKITKQFIPYFETAIFKSAYTSFMEQLQIIKASPEDVIQLQKISIDTFRQTFAKDNTKENMDQYIEEKLTTEQLLNELSNPLSEFYFAKLDEQIIGYIKVNFGAAQTEIFDQDAAELERIYVSKEYQRQKAGQRLYEKVIEIARQNNAPYLWLGVWEHNETAIRFYRKNGFTEFDKHIFKLGNDEQTDIMMKLKLD
jgi:diamine N-acetyltransferase